MRRVAMENSSCETRAGERRDLSFPRPAWGSAIEAQVDTKSFGIPVLLETRGALYDEQHQHRGVRQHADLVRSLESARRNGQGDGLLAILAR